MSKLKVVYYAYLNNDNQKVSPFLDYLQKYDYDSNKDSELAIDKKIQQLANIRSFVDHVGSRGGKYNLPPIVEQYHGTEIGMIKVKEGKSLARVAFVTFVDDKMVILGAIDKPNLYEKMKKKKVNKEIEIFLDTMEEYRRDYLENGLHVEFHD